MNNLQTFDHYESLKNISVLQFFANFKKSKKTDYNYKKDTLPVVINGVNTGVYINSDPFSYGNMKLNKNIAVFSLLPVITCLNCKDCKKDCYALKATRQYVETYNKRLIYTILAYNNPELLQQLIITSLSKHKNIKYVRIHEAGDFFNQNYVDMWTNVARCFPNITFYFYTKVDHIFNFSEFENLPNVNKVNSILPDGKKNFDPENILIERLQAIEKNSGLKIDVCPAVKNKNIHCGLNCNLCMRRKNVAFIEH